MIADCFSKVSFIELCLIFYLSVYPMACKNDVIVLMQRKNKLLVDPIFEENVDLHCVGYCTLPMINYVPLSTLPK